MCSYPDPHPHIRIRIKIKHVKDLAITFVRIRIRNRKLRSEKWLSSDNKNFLRLERVSIVNKDTNMNIPLTDTDT